MTLSLAKRHSQILEILDQRGALSVAEIARDFGVSPVTARHDLAVLAGSGLIRRIRGGARANSAAQSEPNFELRRRHRAAEKLAIALAANQLLGDAQIIALDASTTCYYLALELRPTSDLFVVTNGLKTAEALTDRQHISVMLTGGIVRRGAMSIVGEIAEEQISKTRVEIAFFGARAFNTEHGLMDFDPEEARIKRAMASISDRVVGLVDHSKWGRLALLPPVVPIDELTAIVCDRRPPPDTLHDLGIATSLSSSVPTRPAGPTVRAAPPQPRRDSVSQTDLVSLSPDLGSLPLLAKGVTRSISAENPTGASGAGGQATEGAMAEAARELGQGWKVSPWIAVAGGATVVLADITGPAAIQHMWLTCDSRFWRALILRCHWDDEDTPSVEVPLGDFFCNGWCVPSNVSSVPVAVNPLGGLNSYWPTPFRHRARITIENLGQDEVPIFAYQITYCEAPVGDDAAYFHAHWLRSNPVPGGAVHPLIDIRGQGHYVGTYMALGVNNAGWWGEGEFKFYLDDDDRWPSICGTGTEDYFGGAWCFEQPQGAYATYSTPFLGLNQVIRPDGFQQSQQRFGMYRWHIKDPIRFQRRLRATVQDLGWRSPQQGKVRFMARHDDIATTAFWYQAEPHGEHVPLPDANTLEVI